MNVCRTIQYYRVKCLYTMSSQPIYLECYFVKWSWSDSRSLSLQMFRSAQTGIIILNGAKLSPDTFKTWEFLIKFRNLRILICLFITTVTFFTISTFHCLTEILYGHGGPIVIWFHLHSRNLWTKLMGLTLSCLTTTVVVVPHR